MGLVLSAVIIECFFTNLFRFLMLQELACDNKRATPILSTPYELIGGEVGLPRPLQKQFYSIGRVWMYARMSTISCHDQPRLTPAGIFEAG